MRRRFVEVELKKKYTGKVFAVLNPGYITCVDEKSLRVLNRSRRIDKTYMGCDIRSLDIPRLQVPRKTGKKPFRFVDIER